MGPRNLVNQSARSRRKRSAAAAVELAIVLPVLVLMTLGMLQLGRAIMVRQILTDAARAGCRTGILPQYGNSNINSDVGTVMSDNGFASAQSNPPTV